MYVESQSNGMQKAEALRRVEFKKNVAPHVNIINYLGACSSGKKSMCLLPGGGEGRWSVYRHRAKRNAIYRVVEFTAVAGVIVWEKRFANFMNELLFATNFPSLLLLYV